MNTQSVNTSLYQKGDISLERIYGKYRNSFIRYAGKVLSDEFYAEDVVQDVFTGLFQQTNYFVSEMAALKCIYITIYNRSIDMLRHKQIVQHYETAHSDKKREEVFRSYSSSADTFESAINAESRLVIKTEG